MKHENFRLEGVEREETMANTLNDKLQDAINDAEQIDVLIIKLNAKVGQLVGDMQGEKRPHESGLLIGLQQNLNDSFYRKLARTLEGMQK